MEIIKSNNGIYEINNNYIVARYNTAVNVTTQNEGDFIIELLSSSFTGNFGWISDRVNSYSFDPILINYVTNNFYNIKFFASVSYGKLAKNPSFINDVFPKSIAIKDFSSLNQAIEWVESSLININE